MNYEHYTPNTVARNITKKGDILEIKRYNDANLRELAWIWFLVVCFFLIKDVVNQGRIYKDIQWALYPEKRIEKLFDLFEDSHNKGYSVLGETYSEFKEKTIQEFATKRVIGTFFIALPFILLLWVGAPHWRPLRIDTKRRLIYTWSFGRFYITSYPTWSKTTNSVIYHLDTSMKQPWIRYPHHGGLVFHLPHETKAHKKVAIDVGIFRPACHYQNYVLKEFLNDYLSSDNPNEEFEKYFKKESFILSDLFNIFYRFSIFPTLGYNEKKTEKHIQEWLKNHPE